jgi:hypothetical protein
MECMTRYSAVRAISAERANSAVTAIPDGRQSRRGAVNATVCAWSADSTSEQVPGRPTPPRSIGNMGDQAVPGFVGNNPGSLDLTMTTHRIVDVERTCRAFRVASSQKEGSS